MKKITIKTFGGLANRMRAIDSAWLFAKKFGLPLEIIWEKSFELNCSFNRLFTLPPDIHLREYSIGRFAKKMKNASVKLARKAGIRFPLGYSRHLYDDEVLDLNRQKYNYDQLGTYPTIYIDTVNRFYNGPEALDLFKPVPSLLKKIGDLTSVFDSHTIGIHIRRSDNIQAIQHSPLEAFIHFMEKEALRYPEVKFYLATDSPEVEHELNTRFPGRIIIHRKTLDRNSEKGIQDALIDLYCLSRTSRIIGSYYSSFSEVAAQISGIELTQIYKAN